MVGERPVTFVFRQDGSYWGFLLEGLLYDRHGHHVGWLEDRVGEEPDVFAVSGHFLGELCDGHYVFRNVLRPEPILDAAREPVPVLTPPAPPPERAPVVPRDGWSDALPWPIRPPEPPQR